MIPTTILPFNLLKGFLNVGIVLLLYKPLSRALHRLGILKSSIRAQEKQIGEVQISDKRGLPKGALTSIIVTAIAALVIVASVVLIFTVMKGSF